jgi:[ribosomal protein S5]-alanine N-acetyltransferase
VQIRTQRLLLRPPRLADAARVSLLAGDYDIASMTGTLPHPYSEQMAAAWIADALQGEEGVVFMIERDGTLIGCTGYRAFGPDYAELGYWIGKPYWGQGYATEAACAVIAHAFDTDGFDYLKVGHFSDNPASERVILKLGFVAQGGEVRDCAARGTTTDCVTYRLDRARARALFASA